MQTNMKTNPIPVFYAADNNYLPFLGVALASLIGHADKQREYAVHVLTSGKLGENGRKIKEMQTRNVRVYFHDVGNKVERITHMLHCRDYYTSAIFYRLFIPDMFPQYEKAIYLDCDTVLNTDIAQLYDIDICDCLIGAVTDQAVASVAAFRAYTKNALGIAADKYFNSGVITLNLKEMRKIHFYAAFCAILQSYHFIVAPDQDCLNLICKDRVHYYPKEWNAMPIGGKGKQPPKLVHYNLSLKPWHYKNVPYEEYFWKFAAQTVFYEEVKAKQASFTPEQALRDEESGAKLIALAQAEADSPCNYLQSVVLGIKNQRDNLLKEGSRYAFIDNFTRTFGSTQSD